tara:strand:+ start:1286 stop:1393 length:108 start_codon:yes stop_codon:yes gene_type:complete
MLPDVLLGFPVNRNSSFRRNRTGEQPETPVSDGRF